MLLPEKRCRKLPVATELPGLLFDEQGHVELRIQRRGGQRLHGNVGQGFAAYGQVVHHEQHLHQRVHAAHPRGAMGLDDHVERQVLMLQGREQDALGALHEVTEGQPITHPGTQRQHIDEEADQAFQFAVLAACGVGPDQYVVGTAGLVHQPLERRQQRAVQGHPGLGRELAKRIGQCRRQAEVHRTAGMGGLLAARLFQWQLKAAGMARQGLLPVACLALQLTRLLEGLLPQGKV
ncbi:hypothetical protein D9M71_400980 [compost metagenome]